uniref:CDK5 regulatory subunit associated protein 1 like 1 n=2 Tax=Taeniopygia guttata TaxID=59729 RepID=A0A674GGS1_TAEGU
MPAACESVLEDIEDIVSAEDLKPHDRQFVRRNVFPKVRKRNSQKNIQTDDEPPSDSIIPGVQKIWIRTWGCSHNNSDGEYMAGQLAAYGYTITAHLRRGKKEEDKEARMISLRPHIEKKTDVK